VHINKPNELALALVPSHPQASTVVHYPPCTHTETHTVDVLTLYCRSQLELISA